SLKTTFRSNAFFSSLLYQGHARLPLMLVRLFLPLNERFDRVFRYRCYRYQPKRHVLSTVRNDENLAVEFAFSRSAGSGREPQQRGAKSEKDERSRPGLHFHFPPPWRTS